MYSAQCSSSSFCCVVIVRITIKHHSRINGESLGNLFHMHYIKLPIDNNVIYSFMCYLNVFL